MGQVEQMGAAGFGGAGIGGWRAQNPNPTRHFLAGGGPARLATARFATPISDYNKLPEDSYAWSRAPRSTKKGKAGRQGHIKKKVDRLDSTDVGPSIVNTITKDNLKKDMPDFIMHHGVRHYWTTVEVPTIVHRSK